MAWQDITYACGHPGREQLYGPHRYRDRYAANAGKHKLCKDCWRARQEADPETPTAYMRHLPGSGEVEIYVLNSYAVRDMLKSRGYRLGEYTRPDDAMMAGVAALTQHPVTKRMMATPKGWGKTWPQADEQSIRAEINWLLSQNDGNYYWRVEIVGSVQSIFQATIEGRVDLIPVVRT